MSGQSDRIERQAKQSDTVEKLAESYRLLSQEQTHYFDRVLTNLDESVADGKFHFNIGRRLFSVTVQEEEV